MKKNILVIFTPELSDREAKRLAGTHYSEVIAPTALRERCAHVADTFIPLEDLILPGSIYEANLLVQEFSQLTFPNGERMSRAVMYKGYELWWIHYHNMFLRNCLPYTRYKQLLEYIIGFEEAHLYEPVSQNLFSCYLRAHSVRHTTHTRGGFRTLLSKLHPGIVIQGLITLISLPFLMVLRRKLFVFTGDKFAKDLDFDFRMKFVYEELRARKLPFVECIRSLESWKNVLAHALVRRRPVLYAESVTALGSVIAFFIGSQRRAEQKYGDNVFKEMTDPFERFKRYIVAGYLLKADRDIWAIRIMHSILRLIGVRSAFFTAALDRNYHTVLACKLAGIPTVGILHGVASKNYNTYDFLPTYDGSAPMGLDQYGVWSEWWREYYATNGRVYTKNQLVVSGPMRPLLGVPEEVKRKGKPQKTLRVLFVSEQLAIPSETVPYLEALLADPDIGVAMLFRPYRDGFEVWLQENRPDILERIGTEHMFRDGARNAAKKCDVTVGSHSTAVLEALFEKCPIVFFGTNKWGDYFDLKEYGGAHTLYAEGTPMFLKAVKESVHMPEETLQNLAEQFFGDPYQNGSAWVVDQLEAGLKRN